jgi:hypothetical protein
MGREGGVNDPSHRWPRSERPVPTAGPLLLLFAGTFSQPELALPETLLATTFWSLRDQGLISFGSLTKDVLRQWAFQGPGAPTREVHELDVVRDKEGNRPGLEGQVLSALDTASQRRPRKRWRSTDPGEAHSKPPSASIEVRCTVVKVVCSWFGRGRSFPTSHVMKQARKELFALGYGGAENRRLLSRFLDQVGELAPQPTDEDIRDLRAEAERVVSGWRSFLLNEPGLSQELLESCASGISVMETGSFARALRERD